MYRQRQEALHPAGIVRRNGPFPSSDRDRWVEMQKRVGVERGPPAGQRDLGAGMREDGRVPVQQFCDNQMWSPLVGSWLSRWKTAKKKKKLIGKTESHQAAAFSCTLATGLKASQASNKYELIIKYKSEEIIVLPAWLPARLLLRGCWAAFLSDSGSTLCPEKRSGTPSSWLSAAVFAWTEPFLFQPCPSSTPRGASPELFFFLFFNKQLNLPSFPRDWSQKTPQCQE